MANSPVGNTASSAVPENKVPLKAETLGSLLQRPEIKDRFKEVLRDRGPGFMSSILSLYNMTPQLRSCDPMSIVSSAMIAATLDLPINPNLGFAYIVPYGNQAQFQMGYRGFVQLAIRTNKYKTMNVSEVYEDEFLSWNPITGVLQMTDQKTWKQRAANEKGKIVGYAAFFQLSGEDAFEKYDHATVAEVMEHGKKYSKSFQKGFGPWKDDFNAMGKKTVLKRLLNHWGMLSIEMQEAMTYDQGIVRGLSKEDRTVEFPDAINVQAMQADDDTPKEMVNDAQESAPQEKAPLSPSSKELFPKK